MDSPVDIFKFHLSAIHHNVLIPELDEHLRIALNSLISGKLTSEKYPYYLMYGMLNGFDIVHNRVGRLESQNAHFKNQILNLQEQIDKLKN